LSDIFHQLPQQKRVHISYPLTYVTYPILLYLFNLMTIFNGSVQIMKLLTCNFCHIPGPFFIPFKWTLFLNPNLHSLLMVRDQVSYPHNTRVRL
jgi:hypothetical protein